MDSADTALMGDLTETEKALLGSQEIVKIQGKVCSKSSLKILKYVQHILYIINTPNPYIEKLSL